MKEDKHIILTSRTSIVNELEITLRNVVVKETNEKKIHCIASEIHEGIADHNNPIWNGYLSSKMTPLEIYHALTAEKRFFLEDELLTKYKIFGSDEGKIERVREEEARKKNVPTSEIIVVNYKHEIYTNKVVA